MCQQCYGYFRKYGYLGKEYGFMQGTFMILKVSYLVKISGNRNIRHLLLFKKD